MKNLQPEKKHNDEPSDNDPIEFNTEDNILRQRTFNEELRQILDRINYNEGSIQSIVPESSPDEINSYSVEELLHHLHSLFYRTKYIEDYHDSNTILNPFTPGFLNEENNFQNVIIGTISSQLKKLGFDSFAILKYDSLTKGYIPFINNIDYIDNTHFIISIREKLFSSLLTNQYGILINEKDLENDPFLQKKFFFPENNSNSVKLYCILTHNLIEKSIDDKGDIGQSITFPLEPSPVLLVNLSIREEGIEEKPLFRILKKQCSLLFLLLNSSEGSNNSMGITSFYERCSRVSGMFLNNKDSVCLTIRGKKDDYRSYFIIEFLLSKIKRQLKNDSSIIQFNIITPVILTTQDGLKMINSYIREINNLFDDIIILDVKPASDFKNSSEVLTTLIFTQ